MGPAMRTDYRLCGWGRRIRTPATWSRATRPTTRRSPTTPQTPTYLTTSQRTAVLRVRLGRKRGTLAVGILISEPVRGSRPFRAARRVTTNVPNPEMVTRRPRRSESKMLARRVFMAFSAAVLELPDVLAMIATSSALVMRAPPPPPPLYSRRAGGVNGSSERRGWRRRIAWLGQADRVTGQ